MGCSSREDIIKLLKSNDKNEIILGAYKAGESQNKEYVPLLLLNPFDARRSTNLRFYGITVYQEKMNALAKIFHENPPEKIGVNPDSAVVFFYKKLAK